MISNAAGHYKDTYRRSASLMESISEDGDLHICGNCRQTFHRLELWIEHKQLQWCKRTVTQHITLNPTIPASTSDFLPNNHQKPGTTAETPPDSSDHNERVKSHQAEMMDAEFTSPMRKQLYPINPRKRERTRSRKQEYPQPLSGMEVKPEPSGPSSADSRISSDCEGGTREQQTSSTDSTFTQRVQGRPQRLNQAGTMLANTGVASHVSPSPTSPPGPSVLSPPDPLVSVKAELAALPEGPSCRRPYILPRVYSCPRCTKNFIKLSHLHRHMNKKKPCEMKEAECIDDNSDDDCKVSLPQDVMFTCGLCSQPLSSYEAVMSHHTDKHPAYYAGYCRFCGKFKDRKNKLLIHLVKHDHASIVDQVSVEVKRIRHTKIDKPNSGAVQSATVSGPVVLGTTLQNIEVSCPTCKSKFYDRDELVCHFNDYHSPVGMAVSEPEIFELMDDKSADILKCFICCLKFLTKAAFEAHIDTHLVWSEKVAPVMIQHSKSSLDFRRSTSQSEIEGMDSHNNNTEDVMDLSVGKKRRQSEISRFPSTSTSVSDSSTPEAVIGSAFSCWICPAQAHDLPSWRRHVIEEHQLPLVFRCVVDECRNEYRTWNELYEHRTEHLQRSYVCKVCNDHQPTRSLLANHTQTHHQMVNSTPTICTYCQCLIFENIELHRSTCSQQIVVCSECNEKIKRMSLPKHMLNHSTAAQTMNYVCEQCNSAFPIRDRLGQHMKNVHGPRKYVCADCGAAFKRNDKLQRHSQCCHSDIKPFVCPIVVCGRAFKRIDGLRAHLKCSHISDSLINSQTNQHGCTVCGNTLPNTDRLVDHLMSHVREAPSSTVSPPTDFYGSMLAGPSGGESVTEPSPHLRQCPHCPAQLSSESLLFAHILQIHAPNPAMLQHAGLPLPFFMLPQLNMSHFAPVTEKNN